MQPSGYDVRLFVHPAFLPAPLLPSSPYLFLPTSQQSKYIKSPTDILNTHSHKLYQFNLSFSTSHAPTSALQLLYPPHPCSLSASSSCSPILSLIPFLSSPTPPQISIVSFIPSCEYSRIRVLRSPNLVLALGLVSSAGVHTGSQSDGAERFPTPRQTPRYPRYPDRYLPTLRPTSFSTYISSVGYY